MKSVFCILFILLFLVLPVRSKKEFKNQTDEHKKGCVATNDMMSKCKLQHTTSFFTSGQSCRSDDFNSSHFTEYKCINGKWITETYGTFSLREKRQLDWIGTGTALGGTMGGLAGGQLGADIGSAIGFLVGGILQMCSLFCKNKDHKKQQSELSAPPPNKPPTIDCESFKIPNPPPSGETEVEIKFGPFEGKDPEDGSIEVTSTPTSPAKLHRGTNIIAFTGQDKEGFLAYCRRQIELKVISCDQPQCPDHGYVHCQHGEVLLGSRCTVTCHDGYELKGSKELKCIGQNKYDHPSPTCSLVHCFNNSNIQLPHGHAYCDDKTLAYGTICLSDCAKGYGTNSLKFSKCKRDSKWSTKLPACEDKEAPSFIYCPSTIHAYADKGKDMATVSWRRPTAIDNSGQVPIITRRKGLQPGSLFKGFTEISYVAKDSSDNESPPCTFFIFVEKQFCDPPVFNAGGYIQYKCGKDGYQYGSECTISCRGSYPLIGNNKMICEKNATSNELYWDWGAQEKPYCKQNKCPALTTPKNGALACDKWMFGTQCTMQCNDKFDIPLGIGGFVTFTGLFTCSTVVGKWSPIETVPGCTSRRIGKNHRLPAELLYSGDCNDDATKRQIKQNFVNLMQNLEMDPGYKGVCPSKDVCNVENVEVACGSKRKRRYSGKKISARSANNDIILTFEFVRKYESYGNGTVDALNHAKTQFAVMQNITTKLMNQGLLDVSNAHIEKLSLQFGEVDIDCGPGRFPKYSTLTCGACASGSYLDETTEKCTHCQVGTYKEDEDALNCTSCPTGTSTQDEGTTNATDCKEMCKPGYYSLNGLVPCSPCALGSYTHTIKAKQCKRCPDNKSTEQSGSSHATDCITYDVRLESPDVTVDLRSNVGSIQTLSMSLWCRVASDNSILEINIGGSDGLVLRLSSKIELNYARQDYSTGVNIDKYTWTHFGLVLDASSTLHSYKDGNSIYSKQVVTKTFTSNTANFKSHMGVEISGLVVSETPFTPSEMVKLSRSCVANISNHLLTTKDMLKQNSTAFEINIPSVCDAVNECEPNPCNGHICQNELFGYKCICSGGYTGHHCDVPPNFCEGNDCENGATCTNGVTNYTCICPPRIKGTFCEKTPVDGKWTDWDNWLPCSVSCGGGLRKRYRNCTNPAPGPDGYPCVGNLVEMESCNSVQCPTCPSKPRAYGVRMNCNVSGDTTVCKATCRSGLTFVPGHPSLEHYICGQATNYIWNGHPPSCSKINSPKSITIHSALQYPDFPCSNVNAAKEEIYHNAKTDLQCGQNGTCQIQVDIKGCEGRQKRSTAAKAVITLTIPLTHGDNLNISAYISSKTISPSLVNLLKAVADLEKSAQEINRTGQVFKISGVKVDLDHIHIQTVSEVKCMPGQIRLEAFCVECPTGTFYSPKEQCEPCNYGTYQDVSGQTLCKPCPDGFSTAIVGSQSISLCTVTKAQEDSGTPAGDSTNMLVITVSVVVSAVVVIGIVAALIIRKQNRIKYQKQNMESDMSFNMVKPDSPKPTFSFQKT